MKMTPRQLSYLTKTHKRHTDREALLTGLLASVVANYSMRAPEEPLKPTDFMVGYEEPELSDAEYADRVNKQLKPIVVSSGPHGQ